MVVSVAVSACTSVPPSGGAPSGSSGSAPTSAALSARPTGTTAPAATTAPTPSSPTAETRPPGASLRDSGGLAVVGQVGTFQWAGVVSDSPLLPGSAVTVGVDQDLGLVAAGPAPSSWRAILYTDPANPASGRPFGDGAVPVSLRAPAQTGVWTLAVQLFYPDGDVIHFWRLTVAG